MTPRISMIAALAIVFTPTKCLSQNLLFEVFTGINTTKYEFNYKANDRYLGIGGRIAAGFHKLQLGVEYNQDLTSPKLTLEANGAVVGTDAISSNYLGIHLRTKLCRYPAVRFGLVLRSGVGICNAQLRFTDAVTNQTVTYRYNRHFGANVGMGFSIPFGKYAMIETSYNLYYAKRPDIANFRQSHNASYHSIQVGVSYNFVLGSTKEKYTDIVRRKYGD